MLEFTLNRLILPESNQRLRSALVSGILIYGRVSRFREERGVPLNVTGLGFFLLCQINGGSSCLTR